MGLFDKFFKKNKETTHVYIPQNLDEPEDLSKVEVIDIITPELKKLDSSEAAQHIKEVAANEARKLQNQISQNLFSELEIGKKYEELRFAINKARLGISGDDTNIKTLISILDSPDNVLLPYLYEKESYGILDKSEERILNKARNSAPNNTEFLATMFKSIYTQISIGVFGQVEDEDKIFNQFKAVRSSMEQMLLEKNTNARKK